MKCTYQLLLRGSYPGTSPGTHGEWYSFGLSFLTAEEGSCLALETTLLDHRDIFTGFVRVLVSGISL